MLCMLACASEVALSLGEGPAVRVAPDPIPLFRTEGCERSGVTLQGNTILLGLSFTAEEGDPTAIHLPAITTVGLEGGLSFSLDYCPGDSEPVSGWLLLDFDRSPQLSVWAEEEL